MDETCNPHNVQIDLTSISEAGSEEIEDLMDVMVAEARKDEGKIIRLAIKMRNPQWAWFCGELDVRKNPAMA